MTLDDLVHRVRPSAGEAHGLLVLLHGRGADEDDLFPLFDLLDSERRLIGVCPRGPLTLPPGGSHWYVSRQVGYPDQDTFWETFRLLGGWLEEAGSKVSVPLSRTILGGFSQGAVMAYALSLGKGRPLPAGLLAFSGFIPSVDDFEIELDRRADLPVAIGHGTYDPVIGVEWSRRAKQTLEGAGLTVLYRESAMPHAIDPAYLRDLTSWVVQVLPG